MAYSPISITTIGSWVSLCPCLVLGFHDSPLLIQMCSPIAHPNVLCACNGHNFCLNRVLLPQKGPTSWQGKSRPNFHWLRQSVLYLECHKRSGHKQTSLVSIVLPRRLFAHVALLGFHEGEGNNPKQARDMKLLPLERHVRRCGAVTMGPKMITHTFLFFGN